MDSIPEPGGSGDPATMDQAVGPDELAKVAALHLATSRAFVSVYSRLSGPACFDPVPSAGEGLLQTGEAFALYLRAAKARVNAAFWRNRQGIRDKGTWWRLRICWRAELGYIRALLKFPGLYPLRTKRVG